MAGKGSERTERVKMALREAGYRTHGIGWRSANTGLLGFPSPSALPPEAFWRAAVLAGETDVCWPCWSGSPRYPIDASNGFMLSGPPSCDHDPLTSPSPPTPPVPVDPLKER